MAFSYQVVSLVVDGELLNNIEVTDHNAEFIKGDLSIEVSIGLDDSAVDKLLELHIVEVSTNHHLKHFEELSVGDESVVVDVVDLESEAELVLLGGAG